MKIVFITPVTPFIDGGTSAHIYHLTLGRSNDIEMDIYTFNNNYRTPEEIKAVEEQLNVRIHIIKMPLWIRLLFMFHLSIIRVFLKFPIYYYLKVDKKTTDEIEEKRPDGIWIYGEELASVTRQFPNYRRVHTLPDSEAMYFYRMIQQRFVTKHPMTYWKNILMYKKYVCMEQHYDNHPSIIYHLVGEADADFIKNTNPGIDARFSRHPHYHILNPNRTIKFHQPRIKLLIAGQYNHYMQQAADELFQFICNENENENGLRTKTKNEDERSAMPLCTFRSKNYLKEHYVFTFLGKGWEKHAETMKRAGYEVNHIRFADNYQEELVKHDIQITPIAIGTGTKGKVLDALANGLLVIGTPYAMENIAVKHGESCIEYRTPQEVIEVLKDIPQNIRKYEDMALAGRNAILKYHGRTVVSQTLFGIFKENLNQ